MKYNSIGEQLIAKAQELDPSYKPDKFNDMSDAINIILNMHWKLKLFQIASNISILLYHSLLFIKKN